MFFNLILWTLISIVSLLLAKIISIFSIMPVDRIFYVTFIIIDLIVYLVPTIILYFSGFKKQLTDKQKICYYESASCIVYYQMFKLILMILIVLFLPMALKKVSYVLSSLASAIISMRISYID